jgi:hypothetical protein
VIPLAQRKNLEIYLETGMNSEQTIILGVLENSDLLRKNFLNKLQGGDRLVSSKEIKVLGLGMFFFGVTIFRARGVEAWELRGWRFGVFTEIFEVDDCR